MSALPSLGVVGLGTMGHNLALNALDAGLAVAGTDLDPASVAAFETASDGRALAATSDPGAFLAALPAPRAVLVMVPAGRPVDAVLDAYAPLLGPEDVLIDGGNSFAGDTLRRGEALTARGVAFVGMGISGGEDGARRGPSMMPGGPAEAVARVLPALERMAARVDGEPCVAYVGAGAAGHVVKTVHNGIEYALMQLLAEAYDLMRRGAGLGPDAMAARVAAWNRGPLASYLVEITADILAHRDPLAPGAVLLDAVADRASQKGTGRWTSQAALDLGVPVPTIDAAVSARVLSALHADRAAVSDVLGEPAGALPDGTADDLEGALEAAFVAAFAQGIALIGAASEASGFGTDRATVARIWRGGCIIRAAMLEPIRAALAVAPDLPNLLLAPALAERVRAGRPALRRVVAASALAGIPVPALASALAYVESLATARLPANLVAAQRDYFGAHAFERLDRPGAHHGGWGAAL